MNYLKQAVGLTPSDPTEKVSKVLPVSDKPSECDPSECFHKYNKKCFQLNKAAESDPLWESAKPMDMHVLVSTASTDWKHNAFDVDGMLKKINDFNFDKYGKAKINTTSVDFGDEDYESYKAGKKADLLLLPYFIWVKGLTLENYEDVLNELLTILTKDDGAKSEDIPEDIKGVKIIKDPSRSYVLLCSHRTRDKKCGITAPIMKKEFDSLLRELDMYRDLGDDRAGGVHVIFINHVGGHKFAANVMVYNKNGEFVWFAKCNPLNVSPILNETVLKGEVFPKLIRTAKKFDAISW